MKGNIQEHCKLLYKCTTIVCTYIAFHIYVSICAQYYKVKNFGKLTIAKFARVFYHTVLQLTKYVLESSTVHLLHIMQQLRTFKCIA